MEDSEIQKAKSEDTEKIDSKTEENTVIESVTEDNYGSVKETLDGNDLSLSSHVVDSEKLEEEKVVLDVPVEEPSIDSVKPEVSVSEELAQDAEQPVENSGVASDVSDLKSMVEKIIPLSDENCGVSAAVADLASNGIEHSLDENSGVSPAVTDSTSNEIPEATLPTSNGNVGESSSEAAEFVTKETAANLSQPEDVPAANAGTNGENCDTSKVPNSTENQSFVFVTPHTRTSWMGCCGLFDLLRRSN